MYTTSYVAYSILAWIALCTTLAPLTAEQAFLLAGAIVPLTHGFPHASDHV